MTHLVFFYGTLKQGMSNHHMIKGSKFIGKYETGPGYTKIIQGLPFLIEDGSGPGCTGEVYELTPLKLELIDRLECHPSWYERKLIKVYNKEKNLTLKAWCYLIDKERI